MQIAFEAVPFGYGPASEIVAVAKEISTRLDAEARMIAIGDKTSYRIFESTSVFDDCLRFRYDEGTVPAPTAAELQDADAVMSGHSPTFLAAIEEFDVDVYVINTLDWMNTFDEDVLTDPDIHEVYYAPRLPGTTQGQRGPGAANEADAFVVVNPIRDNQLLSKTEATTANTEDDFMLVNFGGMDSPLGSNDDLALVMASEIATAAESASREWRICLNGGGEVMNAVERQVTSRDIDCETPLETRTKEAFLRDLYQCAALLTVPGLNTTYEALYFGSETMFLLPMNYSQHLQLQQFPEFLTGYEQIRLDQIDPVEPLPPDLPERVGVERCRSQGAVFREDQMARRSFRTQVSTLLEQVSHRRNRIRVADGTDLRFDGAEQIASGVVSAVQDED